MMAHLIIRADATSRIGTGHVMRCLALAQAWQTHGGRITLLSHSDNRLLRQRVEAAGIDFIHLAAQHPDPDDLPATLQALENLKALDRELTPWVVLDGYHFDPSYQQSVRSAGFRLLVIDDCAHLPHYHADVLLNQNVSADELSYPCDADTRLLLGTRYVLLRQEFLGWRTWKRETPTAARKVLVTLGGSDPDNATLKVIRGLRQLESSDVEARIIVGPANPHVAILRRAVEDTKHAGCKLELLESVADMPGLMVWADVAVSAGGTTCWELAFMGVPSIVMVLAENQQNTAAKLGEMEAAISLGDASQLSADRVSETLHELLHDAACRGRMSALGRALVDGRGAERVIAVLQKEQSPHDGTDWHLRPADESDAFLLLHWANDPLVRANSFQSEPIPWQTHEKWYATRLASPDTRIWLLEYRRVPVGEIRYERRDGRTARISYAVAPGYRGRGIGTRLLEMSASKACRELGVRRLRAETLVENVASARAFRKAGFEQIEETIIDGKRSLVFQKEDACDTHEV